MYILGIHPTGIMRGILIMLINLAFFVVVLVMAMKAYRNELGGAMTFGQAFKFGFFVILIATFISSLYSYIFLNFIDPGYLKMVYEETMAGTEEFLSNTGMSAEQVEKAMEDAAKQPVPTVLKSTLQGFIGGIIFSTIVSLIIAAIMKKNPEMKFTEE
jgi:CDP-diglyceride synthetase